MMMYSVSKTSLWRTPLWNQRPVVTMVNMISLKIARPACRNAGWRFRMPAAFRACYRAKLCVRQPRDKAIWPTRDQEPPPTCPGRGTLGQVLPNLEILWDARLLD
jgi:hypothetical protein